MSSHHIVREDQEPALIVEDADGISISGLGQLLEWNPTVVARPESLGPLIEQGVKIDVLITDEPPAMLQDCMLILPPNGTFIDTALDYLVGKRCTAANIISDDADPALLIRYVQCINITLLGNGKRIFIAKTGFSKWKAEGEQVYVYGPEMPYSTTGLIKQDENLFVTEKDGFYSIYFDAGYGLIGEKL